MGQTSMKEHARRIGRGCSMDGHMPGEHPAAFFYCLAPKDRRELK